MQKHTSISIKTRSIIVAALVVFFAAQRSVVASVGDDNKKKEKAVVLRNNGYELTPFGSYSSSLYIRPQNFYKGNFSFVDKAPFSATGREVKSFKQGNTIYLIPNKSANKIPLSKFKVPCKPF